MAIYGGQKQVFALAETLFSDRVRRPSVSGGGGEEVEPLSSWGDRRENTKSTSMSDVAVAV